MHAYSRYPPLGAQRHGGGGVMSMKGRQVHRQARERGHKDDGWLGELPFVRVSAPDPRPHPPPAREHAGVMVNEALWPERQHHHCQCEESHATWRMLAQIKLLKQFIQCKYYSGIYKNSTLTAFSSQLEPNVHIA